MYPMHGTRHGVTREGSMNVYTASCEGPGPADTAGPSLLDGGQEPIPVGGMRRGRLEPRAVPKNAAVDSTWN